MAVYSYVLRMLHAVLSLFVSMMAYWSSIKSKIQFNNSSIASYAITTNSMGMEQGALACCDSLVLTKDMIINTSMKIPSHMSLLLFEDDISMAALATLMVLGYTVGIRNISCYAIQGVKEFNHVSLLKYLREAFLLNGKRVGSDVQVIIRHFISSASGSPVGDSNSLNVYIVSPEHGQGALVQTAIELSRRLKSQSITKDDITSNYIDNHLKSQTSPCPDPELVLKFGAVSSLCGYLPWQMRLAEIIDIPTLRGFNIKSFQQTMHIYNKTEQRFGK